MNRPRGAGLATTLVFTSMLILLAFTLVSMNIFNLGVNTRVTNLGAAREAADAALHRTVARLRQNPGYGLASETVTVNHNRAVGTVTFDTGASLPYSTNFLGQSTSGTGWNGRVVPGASVHLLATGRANNVTTRIEALVHMPRFPYALASVGPIRSNGPLRVSGVTDSLELSGGLAAVDPNAIRPGHLVSNADAGVTPTLELQSTTEITGDVQSAGRVSLASSAVVWGEVREQADPVPVPDLNVQDYDPAGRPGVQEIPDVTGPLQGLVRWNGSGTLTIYGDLDLDEATFYVDGNLVINGGLVGRGAVFVNGATTINRGAALDTTHQVALLSRDTVELLGDGRETYFFKGLVYTEGDLIAQNISLVGSFVANNPGGQTLLDDVDVTYVPDHSGVTVTGNGPPVHIDGSISVAGQLLTGTFDIPAGDFYDAGTGTWLTPTPGSYTITYGMNGTPTTDVGQVGAWLSSLGLPPANVAIVLDSLNNAFITQIANELGNLQAGGTPPTSLYSMRFNEFLQTEDKLRLLYWREMRP